MTPQVLKNIEKLGLEYLVAIGGDDTLSYAAQLDKQGVKVIAIPKTMDNDVRNTEYCIGFSTAITRATDAIERQRTTVGSHERIGDFPHLRPRRRLHGPLHGICHFDALLHPGVQGQSRKTDPPAAEGQEDNPSNYALVLLSEGAEWEGYQVRENGEADAFGHKKRPTSARTLSDEIKKRTGEETIVSDLTYDLRSGNPDFVDKMVASTFAEHGDGLHRAKANTV